MTFEAMAYLMTAAACLLGLRFTLVGAGVLEEWGLEVTIGALILLRRLGLIYFGIALMFFLGRNATPSNFRSAVCLLMSGALLLLAALGLSELHARRAGAGILRSVIGEAVLAVAFLWLWWAG